VYISKWRLLLPKVGMEVKMSFRRKYVDKNRSVFGYFWKAVPVQGGK